MKILLLLFAIIFLSASNAYAQEAEIKNYDLNARINVEAQTVEVEARMRLVNLSGKDLLDKILLAGEDKPRFSFLLNPRAKVSAMSINGATVPVRSNEDVRSNLLRVSTEITSSIASVPEFDLELKYTLSAGERNPFLHVSAGESFLLPPSFWVPVLHTPFADHGADTAPFKLTVAGPSGQKIVSSGIRKSDHSFEQSLADLPLFIAGDYEVLTRGGDRLPVEVYIPRGAGEAAQKQAQRIAEEAERILDFHAKYFAVPVSAPFRIIATHARGLTAATTGGVAQARETTYIGTGTLLIDDSFFRRDALDLGTIELLAATAARAWIDGRVLLRGRGAGVMRDALPIYLAAQYLGARFGDPQREAAFDRYRRAYAPIARGSDSPLLMQSPLDRNYTTSIYNKGALIWRLMEKKIGKNNFDTLIRSLLDRQRVDVLSLNEWRSPLCGLSRCANLKGQLLTSTSDRAAVNELFAQWVEAVVLPDFAIGQPQTSAAGVESTIVNFGTGDFTVDVVAVTESGEKLNRTATVKGGEYGVITFPAGTRLKVIEVDPDKLYVQKDYANDVYPRLAASADSFGQANLALSKGEFPVAEAKAREALGADPDSPTLQALLGRALLGQNKRDEAQKIFETALKNPLTSVQAYAYSHLGLGEILLQQNKPAEAALHFRLAAAADIDPATTIAARDGALRAERAAGTVKLPDDVKAFLGRLDAAILQGSAEAVNPHVDLGNLRRFAQSLVVRKPTAWTTEPLRIEEWDAHRVAVDVALKLKIENRDYAGRALYVLSRAGGKLLLSEVPIFDVK